MNQEEADQDVVDEVSEEVDCSGTSRQFNQSVSQSISQSVRLI